MSVKRTVDCKEMIPSQTSQSRCQQRNTDVLKSKEQQQSQNSRKPCRVDQQTGTVL